MNAQNRLNRRALTARITTLLVVAILSLVGPPTLLPGCDDSGGSTTGTGDGGTPLANPPTRPITDKVSPPDPDQAPAPTLTKIDPSTAARGSVGPTVIATGTGFVPRSVMTVNGQELDTTYESDTEVAATLPSDKLTDVAQLSIAVKTPAPGGGETAGLTFSVENPPPAIIALDPLSVVAGSGDTSITAVGSTFINGSTIHFGTTDLVTSFTDDQHITGVIPAALLTTSASVPVTVTTSAPGGGTSTTIAFTVSNPDAVVTSITPSQATVGAPDFDISVKGTGFVAGSVILFNGTALTTTPGAAGELKATVPASSVATVGELPVTVQNPPPGGGVSAPFVFDVQNPSPVATSVAPASITAGSAPTPITVTGTGFVSGSKITINNVAAATTLGDASHLKATLTAAQLASVANLAVRVTTPAPGGGTSAPLTVAVTAGIPKITAIDPSSIAIGSPDKVITVRGTLFVTGISVSANGQSIASTYVNGGQLSATIPASLLAKAGPIPVVVTNPATGGAGGGASTPTNINVVCDTTDVNISLADLTTIQSFTNDFANAPTLSRWTSDGTCPNVSFSPVITPQPARYAVVENTTLAPVTLSAWADCSNDGKGAAFLTFYRRPTPPANDAERMACENFVADGTPYGSPDSGGSANCPGLTKANGGGMTLGVCERAVIHIQTFDITSTTFTAPPTLKVRAE